MTEMTVKDSDGESVSTNIDEDVTFGGNESLARGCLKVLPLVCFTLCVYIGSIGGYIILPQYIRERLRIEENITAFHSNGTKCTLNTSDPAYIKNGEIQKKSSDLLAAATFAGGVPSMLTVFLYGAFSDRLGRKVIIIIPYFGLLFINLALTLIINLDLPLYFYPIASFIYGLTGSASSMLAGVFAYVADITTKKQRSIAIGVMEGTLGLSMVVSNLVVGALIKVSGYGIPMIGLTAFSAIGFVFLFCVKETRDKQAVRSTSDEGSKCDLIKSTIRAQFQDFKKLLYYNKERCVCLVLITLAFTFQGLTYIGLMGTTTLYLMDQPFCWDSAYYGYFSGIKSLVWLVGAVAVLALLRNRIPDTVLALVSLCSYVIAYVLHGLASSFKLPYCNIIVISGAACGFMVSLAPILFRAMASKLVTKDEQGAAFGLLATGENFAISFGPAIMSEVYSGTVLFLKGFVFYFCTLLIIFQIVFLMIYRFKLRLLQPPSDTDRLLN